VAFLRIVGEGHLINLVGRPSSRLARIRATDAWFRRHLRGETDADPMADRGADRPADRPTDNATTQPLSAVSSTEY